VDVVRSPERVKAMVGFLPQHGLPMRAIGVERALRYTGCLRGQTEADARRQAAALMTDLNLTSYANRDVNTLSGGAIRMVNFAMALMGNPRLLVLDEPTNELDPRNRRIIWEMLESLNTQQGVTCILVTHNVLEAERVVHRVAVLHKGRFAALGTPGEIKNKLGGAVRLEFRLKDADELVSANAFPDLGTVEQIHAGEYRLYLSPDRIGTGVDAVLSRIGFDHFDDFRIAPPSLEDAYLALGSGSEDRT
jgi:ABC-type multidrug transport system ATPase subunit